MGSMLRRWAALVAVACALAVAMVWGGHSPEAAAERPSYLHLVVGQQGDKVVVRGVLYNQDSKPIPGQQVLIAAIPGPRATAVSGRDGWFTVSWAPAGGYTTSVRITASFGGGKGYAASTASAEIAYQGKAKPLPSTAQPSTEASAEASQTPTPEPTSTLVTPRLTAKSDVPRPEAGQLLHLTGVLSLDTGDVVADAPIEAQINNKPIGPVSVTDDAGRFTVLAQVPEDLAPGRFEIVVVFPGSSTLQPAKVVLALAVPTPAPSETPTPEATPEQTPETVTPPAAEDTPEIEIITPEATATPPPKGDTSALMYAAVGTVAAVGLLGGIAALARSRSAGREPEVIEEEVDLIKDDRPRRAQ